MLKVMENNVNCYDECRFIQWRLFSIVPLSNLRLGCLRTEPGNHNV